MKLHRSTKNRMLFGVCGGLSEITGIDVSIIRIGYIFGIIITGSILFWIYLLLSAILPSD